MAGRFSRGVGELLPRTGRLIKESGDFVNEADLLANATDFTGARVAINEIHYLVHKGVMFSMYAKLAVDGTGDKAYIGLTTDGSTLHLGYLDVQSSEGGVEIRIREGATFTGGTAFTPRNRSRRHNGIIASTVSATIDPTVTDAGVILGQIGLPAASTPNARSTVGDLENIEWIFADGESYVIELENLTATDKTIYTDMIWYEPGLIGT